ncbi:MAG: hypothetical protein KKD65_13145 [Gammaproteobacteria bacterium]|nr:hypothetical protein [Gammaproteobacteria bacterium]
MGEKKLKRVSAFGSSGPVTVVNRGSYPFEKHIEADPFSYWDLDIIVDRGSWVMLELDEGDISDIPHLDMLRTQGKGTIVLWQNLDRLTVDESSMDTALGQQMDHARSHLSLVFHRFISYSTH